jgi:hypothetical protein
MKNRTVTKRCLRCGHAGPYKVRERRCKQERRFGRLRSGYACFGTLVRVVRARPKVNVARLRERLEAKLAAQVVALPIMLSNVKAAMAHLRERRRDYRAVRREIDRLRRALAKLPTPERDVPVVRGVTLEQP